jgi:hypothetical protein
MVQRLFAALFATLGAGALAATPAPAERVLRAHFAYSGALTLSWHGDPDRGCADVGVCAYSGSLTVRPPDDGTLTVQRGVVSGFSSAGSSDEPVVVRVQRDEGGGSAGGCVDALPRELLGFSAEPAPGGRFSVRVGGLEGALSTGRCAGPLPDELAGAVRAQTVDLAALTRHGTELRWPSAPYVAGPFSGQVTSNLAARVTRLRPQRQPTLHSPRPAVPARLHGRRFWVTTGGWSYRVQSLSGTLSADVHGGADCLLLDSCGLAGSAEYRLAAARGRFEILTERAALTPPPRTRTGRLDLKRLSINGFGELTNASGTIAGSVQRPGAPPCADQRSAVLPGITLERGGAGFVVSLGGEHVVGPDIVRTHCPGPTQADVFGEGSVARGSIPLTALGRSRISVSLTRPGTFAAPGYAGTRRGTVALELRLASTRRLHTVTRRVP